MKDSYSELKNKLDQIISKIEDSNTDLDQALVLHAEGKKLLEKLDKYLGEVKEKISAAKDK